MNQEKVWDFIAESWDEYRQKPLKQVEEFLAGKRRGKILDLGCGSGRNWVKGFSWYGVDFSEEMVKLARKKDYVKVIKSEAYELPFKDNWFDYALYVATLHCIEDKELREKSLAELTRVLKPRGKALISVWDKKAEKFKDFEDVAYLSWGERGSKKKVKRYYYLYEKTEFLRLLRKYFKIIKILDKTDYKDQSSRRFAKRNLVVEVEKI